MNIQTDKPVMVFKRENIYGSFYDIGLSKKDQNGNYVNGYMPCQFKSNVTLDNKTKIYIKKAWLSFYIKNKSTKPYIFISEFETMKDTIEKAKDDINDPFAEYGQTIDDDFLD